METRAKMQEMQLNTQPPVSVYEVSPRDGLQNEITVLPADVKVELITRLIAAGVRDIEVTSFVRPSWIPQLADAAEVVARLPHTDGVNFWGLIPNRRGLDRAIDGGLTHVATFMSASETHNQKNLNRTQRETLSAQREVIESAKAESLTVRAYISTVFGCPYEGKVKISRTVQLARQLLESGADIIVLGDTIGSGNPNQVAAVVSAVTEAGIPIEQLALHMHDTRGTAVANVVAGLQAGVRIFDGSVGGVGGCPYAPGAAGNAATEDLVHVLEAMGWNTNIDLDAIAEVGVFLSDALGRDLPGRMHRYHLANRIRTESRSA
jgi:hydroxymethylglutaryl-CoA lyase